MIYNHLFILHTSAVHNVSNTATGVDHSHSSQFLLFILVKANFRIAPDAALAQLAKDTLSFD